MRDSKWIWRGNARESQPILCAAEIAPALARVRGGHRQIFRKENCVAQWIQRRGSSARDNPRQTWSNRTARGRRWEVESRSEPDWHFEVMKEDGHCARRISPPNRGFPG